jgi:hypothetical protein
VTVDRFWHIAHPTWTSGQPLQCRDLLTEQGEATAWLWDEAPEGTDCDRVCLFPDTDQGRTEARWLLGDRPGYHVVRVDLPDDHDVAVTRAEWEPFPAVLGEIPAEYLTLVDQDQIR